MLGCNYWNSQALSVIIKGFSPQVKNKNGVTNCMDEITKNEEYYLSICGII